MKKIKIILASVIAIITVLLFSFNSNTVSESVLESLSLCHKSVIPSLLPFFIIGEFLMSVIAGAPINITALAFTSGMITGFPGGVKNVCNLYNEKKIDRKTACSLLCCTANASPAYIISFIGGHIIKNKRLGIILLISQCITAILCGIYFKTFSKSQKSKWQIVNLTDSICRSVTESVINCLYVCGYIIFFGVFADILLECQFICKLSPWLKSIIIGSVELTRGLNLIKPQDGLYFFSVSLILAFSGISVIMQCINCCVKASLPPSHVIIGKFCYTLIMPCVSFILNKLGFVLPLFLFALFISLYNIFDKLNVRIYNRLKNRMVD